MANIKTTWDQVVNGKYPVKLVGNDTDGYAIATTADGGGNPLPDTTGKDGDVLSVVGTDATWTAAHYSQFAPSNPTGTASATPVMMGLGATVTFTPTQTGVLDIDFDGAINSNQATAGKGGDVQIAYGTGAAPSNGDAATGTTAGVIFPYVNPAGTTVAVGWRRHARITGLILNTAYWIDLQVSASVAGTVSVSAIEAIITEVR